MSGLLFLGLLATSAVGATPSAPSATSAEPTVEELLNSTDDLTRGASSHAVVEMHVKTSTYDRTMKMEMWSQGKDDTLVRVLEPAKEAGVATLKVGDNIWNYLPKVDRTIKVPASMMSGSWMGSHFTNDDLVKSSRLADDYTYTLTKRPGDDPAGNYVITLVPKPDAPVVWGSIVLTVRPDKMPVSIVYDDEKGAVVRTMTFSDYETFGKRQAPAEMKVVPADKPDEFTEFKYDQLDFDVKVPDGTFTLQSLKP